MFHRLKRLSVCSRYLHKQQNLMASQTPHHGSSHLHLMDLGMCVKKLFKLCRVYVFSSSDYHVLAATYNLAVTMFVKHSNVPASDTIQSFHADPEVPRKLPLKYSVFFILIRCTYFFFLHRWEIIRKEFEFSVYHKILDSSV